MDKATPHGILTHGDEVKQLYQDFLDAGAEVITAQTFRGSRNWLEQAGHADKFEEIHHWAVKLAREVAGDKALVAGVVTSPNWIHEITATPEEVYEYAREQAELLVALGADFLMLEGSWWVHEALIQLKAAKEAAGSRTLAVMASVVFRTKETQDGYSAADCAKALEDGGADIVGIHCEQDPESITCLIEPMRRSVDAPIAAQPVTIRCAPHFTCWESKVPWHKRTLSSGEMAAFARQARDMGINYIGSCCGSGPEHVRAMALALDKSPGA